MVLILWHCRFEDCGGCEINMQMCRYANMQINTQSYIGKFAHLQISTLTSQHVNRSEKPPQSLR